jgi:hypothetical protein
VFLVSADNTVSLRKITIGDAANGQTVVTAGLELGDTVVLDGTSRLRAGSKVTIVTAAEAAAAASDTAPAQQGKKKGGGKRKPKADGSGTGP